MTREDVKVVIDAFLEQARRSTVVWDVVCDESNNPPESVEKGFLNVTFKPRLAVKEITIDIADLVK